jgi:two-component sensor histidine kinase
LPEPGAKIARDAIARQVPVMERLVDDSLDVSHISRNTLDLREQRVELAAVVDGAVESSGPLIRQCGHELTVRLPPQPLHLDAGPVRLAQVVANLLNNAAKYTNRGGHIRLTAERDGSDAVVRVRDDGIGIPGDMLARIFDIFTQVDRTLERSQRGVGIGLTLVRLLVEMHDGSIEARSDGPDRGSEFVVRLPLIQPPPKGPPPSERPRAKALSGCRVLVVDDNRTRPTVWGCCCGSRATLPGPPPTAWRRWGGGDVPPRAGAAGHRPSETERLRRRPTDSSAAAGPGRGPDRVNRLGQDEDRLRSREAGFDFHVVKPLDLVTLE